MTELGTASMVPMEPAIVRPTTTAEVAEVLRTATAPVRVMGNGRWLMGGGPFAAAAPLSVRAVAGVSAFSPGDLVLTASAGTTLRELATVAGAEGQMLAVAPYGDDDATIGSVVATGGPAPLAFGDYTIRDLVLGLTVVTGTGDIIRVGGRVVKNVAGFDLVRLHTGAWGTLGVITEVTVRLHAIPAIDAIRCGVVDVPLATLVPRLLEQRAPLPMQLAWTGDTGPVLWARCSGNAARATALQAHVAAMGLRDMAAPADLSALRATPSEADVVRVQAARSDAIAVLDTLQVLLRAHAPTATMVWDPLRGSTRVVAPSLAAVMDELPARARTAGARQALLVIWEQGRRTVRPLSTVEARLKAAFDPRGLLNPQATPETFP